MSFKARAGISSGICRDCSRLKDHHGNCLCSPYSEGLSYDNYKNDNYQNDDDDDDDEDDEDDD